MDYYAHYDKAKKSGQLLKDHLTAVKKEIECRFGPGFMIPGIPTETLYKIACQIGYIHDIGKYTTFFQDYLLKGVLSEYKEHAHFSACFLVKILNAIEIDPTIGKTDKQILFFISYLCIRYHHLDLNMANLLDHVDKYKRILKVQRDNLQGDNFDAIIDELFLTNSLNLSNSIAYFEVSHLLDDRMFISMSCFLRDRFQDEKWFFLIIYLFSLLIDADKHNSAELQLLERRSVSPQEVDKYLRVKHRKTAQNELIFKREKAKNTIITRLKELINDKTGLNEKTFFSITAPTGIGKTLAALQAALILQERIKAELNYVPLIITAIPFINIIEQTRNDYENIFGEHCRLIVNHRLADIVDITKNENEEQSLDKTMLEIEAWEGDVILTTFVQLFQSLFSGRNRSLKKINKLAGSIVILDEVQSIPEKYMPLIGAVLIRLSEYFGVRFILMTATQPKLLDLGDLLLAQSGKSTLRKAKAEELLTDSETYFADMRRTKLISLLEYGELNTQTFISLFLERWCPNQSVLIVVNTIKRSIELYDALIKKICELEYRVPVLYLSTNIIPKHRLSVIRNAHKYLKYHIPIIMVSTQTIEAGVDLDFDIAFRDIAPIESLIQTAGRVNREGRKGDFKPIYVMKLENDSEIYRLHNLAYSKEILNDNREILETSYKSFIETNYNRLLEMPISDKSKEIWNEGIVRLNFEVLETFQLIENTGEIMDVVVECDEYITKLLDAYEYVFENDVTKMDFKLIAEVVGRKSLSEMKKSLTKFERKTVLRIIMSKISRYIIQIRANRLKDNRPIELECRKSEINARTNLLWIPPEQITQYYHKKTGFIDKTNEAFII